MLAAAGARWRAPAWSSRPPPCSPRADACSAPWTVPRAGGGHRTWRQCQGGPSLAGVQAWPVRVRREPSRTPGRVGRRPARIPVAQTGRLLVLGGKTKGLSRSGSWPVDGRSGSSRWTRARADEGGGSGGPWAKPGPVRRGSAGIRGRAAGAEGAGEAGQRAGVRQRGGARLRQPGPKPRHRLEQPRNHRTDGAWRQPGAGPRRRRGPDPSRARGLPARRRRQPRGARRHPVTPSPRPPANSRDPHRRENARMAAMTPRTTSRSPRPPRGPLRRGRAAAARRAAPDHRQRLLPDGHLRRPLRAAAGRRGAGRAATAAPERARRADRRPRRRLLAGARRRRPALGPHHGRRARARPSSTGTATAPLAALSATPSPTRGPTIVETDLRRIRQ